MRADEVAELHAIMRQHGIPGTLTPVTPGDPAGTWRVLDAGRDVTAATLAAAAAARARRPARGFVVAR
ncbi:hypothetical protein ACFVGY_21510 [Streptomyces sp. NPDC127106]|uniref:hypothetical protein n=1 Tax=Streptomyces sp. NPDC127106 TaxID=3345360 RepID=UPI003625F887